MNDLVDEIAKKEAEITKGHLQWLLVGRGSKNYFLNKKEQRNGKGWEEDLFGEAS